MKDPNAMTVEECRDELARNAGWTLNTSYRCPVWERGIESTVACPIPATLDEAAKLLEGCYVEITQLPQDGEYPPLWIARIRHPRPTLLQNGRQLSGHSQLDEKEARFRLRVAVERLARQGEGGGP